MSKSKLNVVSPDEVINDYGADAMRLYELFMGPLEQVKPWQMSGVEGVYRFLQRVWRLVVDEQSDELSSRLSDESESSEPDLQKSLHATTGKVLEDTEALRFNTAISQMMIFVNQATASTTLPREIVGKFLRVLAPYAPHLAEELWARLGERELISGTEWPSHDSTLTAEDNVTVVVQVNGKVRDKVNVPPGIDAGALEKAALQCAGVQRILEGRTPRKVIVVPGRLVNIVA
jgi:leucyl-tRNA synthetase